MTEEIRIFFIEHLKPGIPGERLSPPRRSYQLLLRAKPAPAYAAV
jgi:hypothetical protein